jgi:hypothetical protein
MPECLERAGWFAVKPLAQVAAMSILGTVILGYHAAGVREATINGEGPAMNLQTLAERGAGVARYLAMPKWKRWLARRKIQLKQKLLSLLTRGV